MEQFLVYGICILALSYLLYSILKPLKKKKTGDKNCDHCQ